jgi:hypothetical protein
MQKKLYFDPQAYFYVRLEVFTAVTMKNGVVWDVTLCSSCKNWSFGGNEHLLHQGDKNRWTRNNASCVRRLLDTASVVPSSSILVTLMNEALSYSETSILTRATLLNSPVFCYTKCLLREYDLMWSLMTPESACLISVTSYHKSFCYKRICYNRKLISPSVLYVVGSDWIHL